MKFWITTLLVDLLVPVIILIIGILYIKKPATHINWMHGYRTERSMRNQEAWDFAQRYFGDVCCRLGSCFILLTLILMISVSKQSQKNIITLGNIIGIGECFMMIYLLIPTERALKKKYDS